MKENFRVFTFFIEPSSYTLDLINNIYNPLFMDHIFLNNRVIIAKADVSIPIKSMHRFSFFEKVRFLVKIAKSYQLIIFNGYNRWEFVFLFLLNKFLRNKFCIAIESDTQAKEDFGWKGIFKGIYLKIIFTDKKVLGFPGGSFMHKKLFLKYGMEEENIFLMPMMVNNQKFFMKEKRPESPFIFLYVGRIIPHKNVEFLIKEFLKSFDSHSNVYLKIVGDGESLKELQHRYKTKQNIIFEGAKSGVDLIKAYHSSHVLVIPSLSEPWGLVVNEALSAGLPVLASDRVGAIYDLIYDKNTGLVFDPTVPGKLSLYMKNILQNKNLYERMSVNAQKLMKEYWNYDLYRDSLQKAIRRAEELLKRRDGL